MLVTVNLFNLVTLVRVSIQVSLMILAMIIFKKHLLNRYTAKISYLLIILIALRCLLLIEVQFLMESIPNVLSPLVITTNGIRAQGIVRVHWWLTRQGYLSFLTWVWISGVILLGVYYLERTLKFYNYLSRLKQEIKSPEICTILEQQKQSLNIKRKIKLYQLEGIYSPMLVGILKPEIIIPNKGFANHELQYIFRHELIHYKRKDNMLKLMINFITMIHWFNPIIHLLKKQFNEFAELSCDELVIRKCTHNEIKDYAFLLLDTMKYKKNLSLSMGISYFNLNQIPLTKFRIEQMLTLKKRRNYAFLLIGIIISMTLISVINFYWMSMSPSPSEYEFQILIGNELQTLIIDNSK